MYNPNLSFVSYDHFSHIYCGFITSFDSLTLSRIVNDALSNPNWHDAIIKQMNVLNVNGTQNLVNLPVGKKAISCKQVFSIEVSLNSSVVQLKARLEAGKYDQTYGMDYFDTFSPMATHDWPLH